MELFRYQTQRVETMTQVQPLAITSTLYVTFPSEGFQAPPAPIPSMQVFFNFFFEESMEGSPDMSWKTFFGNILSFPHFIRALDYKDTSLQWTEDEKIDVVRELLKGCLNADTILVNIDGVLYLSTLNWYVNLVIAPFSQLNWPLLGDPPVLF